MKQGKDWMRRLSDGLDLGTEPLPGLPLVEVYADKRVLIENHNGVTQYGRDKISVKVKYGQVLICGNCLELAKMTKHQLIICGKIDSITLCRRNG